MFGCILENVVKNIFWCLVVWLKMLFSYKFFTWQFNPQQQTPAIKSHNHQNTTIIPPQQQKWKSHRNTNKTQEKKIIIRSNWEKKGGRTIGFGVQRIWVRDWGRQIGAAIWVRDLGSRSGFAIWVREVERIQSRTANRSSPLSSSSLSLSLSLSLRAGASSSPSALSLFSGKFLF